MVVQKLVREVVTRTQALKTTKDHREVIEEAEVRVEVRDQEDLKPLLNLTSNQS